MEIRTNAPIAVVGAGTMGMGIAQAAATVGHNVVVLDMSEAAIARGRMALTASLDAATAKGRLDAFARRAIEDRIRWSTDLAQAARTALVIEAIVETLEVKRTLFGALARVVGVDTLLASNTSSLGIGEIATTLAKRGRFLGLHFFNPVPAMKLVEVVAGPETDPTVIGAAMVLMRAWGKTPVQVRDVPGFIVNRVARPYYAEGFLALGEGIPAATIDAALTEAGGFRMGPLALADLIGQDVNYTVATSVYEAAFGLPRFRPQQVQLDLVRNNRLGRKSGRGVYDYPAPMPAPLYSNTTGSPLDVRVGEPGLLRPLVDAARAAGIAVIDDMQAPCETLLVDGIRIGLGDGRILSERADVDVIFDHARDFTGATTIVFSAHDEAAAEKACQYVHAAGRRALRIADRPGQIVLRTLAQLLNAAADTIIDEIACADDVETAMLYGANHPEGPLAWARRAGCDRVRTALRNLTSSTGDALYTPSALFGQN